MANLKSSLVAIASDYFRISRELNYEHCSYLVTRVSEFFNALVITRAEQLGVTVINGRTLSGADYTAVVRGNFVDVFLHWGMQADFLEDLETWNPQYKVTGLSPEVLEVLNGEQYVDHYGELQWMLEYFKEHGTWTTPNAVELAKALMVLKSISSQLTMSGREWYIWNEDGSSKITVFSLSYDSDMEAFFILDEYADEAIDVLHELAVDQNINLEHERLIPVYRVNGTLYFEL